jgi:glucosamine-6-phosphate deaminase
LSPFRQIRNIGFIIHDDPTAVSEYIGNYIARCIAEFAPMASKKFVLGLPTGSSPIPTYEHLIELVKASKLSFKRVISFNMDVYIVIYSIVEKFGSYIVLG